MQKRVKENEDFKTYTKPTQENAKMQKLVKNK